MKGILDGLVEEGWLISQEHPTLDLTIYNYSQKTQFESNWTEWTLMCRGLVVNSKGDIVARPFSKFFNWEEVANTIPASGSYEVYEKMDGSLGIFFWYADEKTETLHPVFASRGSFTSDQAVKGWEMLQKLPYRELA
jgi:RNA ligase